MSNFREIYEDTVVKSNWRPAPDQIIVKPIVDDHSVGDVIDATREPFGKGVVIAWGDRVDAFLDICAGDICYYVRGSSLTINKDGEKFIVIDSFSVKLLEDNQDDEPYISL